MVRTSLFRCPLPSIPHCRHERARRRHRMADDGIVQNQFLQTASLAHSLFKRHCMEWRRPPVNFQDNAEQRVHTVRARFFSARVMAAIAPRIADISYAHLTPSVWQATGKATIYLSWKMYVERVLAAIRAAMCYNPREFTLIKQTEENTLIYCSRF